MTLKQTTPQIQVAQPWLDDSLAVNGQTIKKNFKAWLARSKVMDQSGCPLVVYHGTNAVFDRFEKPAINRMADRAAIGFWFSTEAAEVQRYGSNVVPVFLRIQKPKKLRQRELDMMAVSEPMHLILSRLRSQGYDGIEIAAIEPDRAMAEKGQARQFIAFDATQIKSATSNAGLYLPSSGSLSDQEDADRLASAHRALALQRAPAQSHPASLVRPHSS